MRYALIIFCIAFANSPALAEEIVLEPKTFDAENPVYLSLSPFGKIIKHEKIDTPDNAVAPEGDLEWGKLTLGKREYLFCTAKEGKVYKKLYFDSDGDINLEEEQPITAKKFGASFFCFPVNNVTGEFELGNNSLVQNMNLWIIYICQRSDLSRWVGLFSGYYGEIGAGNIKIPVAWFPGEFKQLVYKPGFAGWVFGNVYFGGKRLSLLEYELAVREDKLRLTYNISEDNSLAAVKVPDGITEVVLYSLEERLRSHEVCIVEDGKAFMPPKKYRFVQTRVIKESAGCKYKLSSTTPGFLASNGSDIGEIFPLKLDLGCSQNYDNVTFEASLEGASGSQIGISKDRESLSSLKLLIKDSEGREVLNKDFKPS